ncbi:MAG: rRNA pseudouridine synthase [Clostridiales bacterium]|nr:rRNA pseudouridine synthase [Clostridiales bacterium]
MERLDKILASQNIGTRKEVRSMVRRGRVMVDGTAVKSPETKVDPYRQSITVDGAVLNYQKYLYLMMNKPAGVVSATRDPKEKTAVDLVPDEYQRSGLFPAGRLDKDTTGFLLITDDGDFAHRMLSPGKHVPKTYHAQLDAPVGEEQCGQFAEGITLGDGFVCLPAQVKMIETDPPVAQVVLHEGKYHQVKRMFAACSRHVRALKRVAIGGVWLDEELEPGDCRPLTQVELERILTGKDE